jgi:CRP/FNR family transcriptional regulator
MDEWLTRYQTWKAFVMQTMSARFTELLKTIDQVAFQNLDIRLVNYLKQKTKSTGSSLVNLSHKQIAEDLNTNRVVISRLLKKLEDQKKILLYRNQIKILRAL